MYNDLKTNKKENYYTTTTSPQGRFLSLLIFFFYKKRKRYPSFQFRLGDDVIYTGLYKFKVVNYIKSKNFARTYVRNGTVRSGIRLGEYRRRASEVYSENTYY